ncbi:hypothetical protein T439DRAFT_383248, partial [Meredithblackwellia eburnea MCA 4105]
GASHGCRPGRRGNALPGALSPRLPEHFNNEGSHLVRGRDTRSTSHHLVLQTGLGLGHPTVADPGFEFPEQDQAHWVPRQHFENLPTAGNHGPQTPSRGHDDRVRSSPSISRESPAPRQHEQSPQPISFGEESHFDSHFFPSEVVPEREKSLSPFYGDLDHEGDLLKSLPRRFHK